MTSPGGEWNPISQELQEVIKKVQYGVEGEIKMKCGFQSR